MNSAKIIQEYHIADCYYCLKSDNIIYVTSVGELSDEQALLSKEAVLKLHNMVEGKICVLVDLNKAGRPSPFSRKMWNDLSEQEEKIVKVALFGLHPVAKIIAAFFIGITRNKKTKFFMNRENALEWLLEKK